MNQAFESRYFFTKYIFILHVVINTEYKLKAIYDRPVSRGLQKRLVVYRSRLRHLRRTVDTFHVSFRVSDFSFQSLTDVNCVAERIMSIGYFASEISSNLHVRKMFISCGDEDIFFIQFSVDRFYSQVGKWALNPNPGEVRSTRKRTNQFNYRSFCTYNYYVNYEE